MTRNYRLTFAFLVLSSGALINCTEAQSNRLKKAKTLLVNTRNYAKILADDFHQRSGFDELEEIYLNLRSASNVTLAHKKISPKNINAEQESKIYSSLSKSLIQASEKIEKTIKNTAKTNTKIVQSKLMILKLQIEIIVEKLKKPLEYFKD